MSRSFAIIPVLLLLGGGTVLVEGPNVDVDWGTLSFPWFGDDKDVEDPSDIDNEVDGETDGTDDESEPCVQRDSLVSTVRDMGFERGDFVVGASAIDWSQLPDTNTDRAFSSDPLTSWYEVRDFLTEGTKKSEVLDGVTDDGEIDLSDDGRWIPVQFQVPIEYDGNNYWDGHQDVSAGAQRAPAGDVWWFNVEENGCGVNPTDSLRAACGNPGFFHLNPARRD